MANDPLTAWRFYREDVPEPLLGVYDDITGTTGMVSRCVAATLVYLYCRYADVPHRSQDDVAMEYHTTSVTIREHQRRYGDRVRAVLDETASKRAEDRD